LFEPERTSILHARQRRTFLLYPGGNFFFPFPDGFLKASQMSKKIQAEGSDLQRLSLFLAFWQDQFLADLFPGDRSLKDPV